MAVLTVQCHSNPKLPFTRVKEVNGQWRFNLGEKTVWMAKGAAAYPDSLAQAVKAKGVSPKDALSV